jgi:hypothetical protein
MSRTHYVVRQGDTLSRIAYRAGLPPEEIWSHPDNADLRERRPNPEVLAPGDIVVLPRTEPQSAEFSNGGTQRYRARVPDTSVSLAVVVGGLPVENEPYEIVGVPGREPLAGTTGAHGVIRFTVPITVTEVDIRLPRREQRLHLRIGHLDPPEERSGAEARLRQLGYMLPRARDLLGDLLPEELEDVEGGICTYDAALEQFQRDHDIDPSGRICERTATALRGRHGS